MIKRAVFSTKWHLIKNFTNLSKTRCIAFKLLVKLILFKHIFSFQDLNRVSGSAPGQFSKFTEKLHFFTTGFSRIQQLGKFHQVIGICVINETQGTQEKHKTDNNHANDIFRERLLVKSLRVGHKLMRI